MCQRRSSSDALARKFYPEGEFIAAGSEKYYYGPDQLGTPRVVGDPDDGVAYLYDYDPFGNPTATPSGDPLVEMRYAGLFYEGTSGLYLGQYRAYDPRLGRWLSRDPVGEASDPAANLYRYAEGNPISIIDPAGTQGWVGAGIGLITGGIYGFVSAEAAGESVAGIAASATLGAFAGAGVGFVNVSAPAAALVGAVAGATADVAAQEAPSVVGSEALVPINPGEVVGAGLLGAAVGALGPVAGTAGLSPAAAGLLGGYVWAPLALLPNLGAGIWNFSFPACPPASAAPAG